jgi:homoserine kinase
VEVVDIYGDEGRLPRDSQRNTAAIAAQSVLDAIQAEQGIRLWLQKGLPLASGLGSSAASAVAAAVATNALFGEPLAREDLLSAVLDAEEAVSNARHADNVAPSLLGGIVLVTGLAPSEIHRLPVPQGLHLALITPQVAVPTAEARAILPKVVPLNVLVHQTGVIAELIHALHIGNIALLAQAMQGDAIVEPAREVLIPHMAKIREVARRVGALVTIISGSGPTLCSICPTVEDAKAVQEATLAVYADYGMPCHSHVTVPAIQGARIIEAVL